MQLWLLNVRRIISKVHYIMLCKTLSTLYSSQLPKSFKIFIVHDPIHSRDRELYLPTVIQLKHPQCVDHHSLTAGWASQHAENSRSRHTLNQIRQLAAVGCYHRNLLYYIYEMNFCSENCRCTYMSVISSTITVCQITLIS